MSGKTNEPKNQGTSAEPTISSSADTAVPQVNDSSDTSKVLTPPNSDSPSVDAIAAQLFERLQRRHAAITRDRVTDGSISLDYQQWQQEAYKNPRHLRGAMQYLHDMIEHFGYREVHDNITGETHQVSVVFDDPFEHGRHAIQGQTEAKLTLQKLIKSYAQDLGDQRALVLVGPVATGKTNFQTVLAKGLEAYSRTREGILPRTSWLLPEDWERKETILGFGKGPRESASGRWKSHQRKDLTLLDCPQFDHPFTLLDRLSRREMITSIQASTIIGAANKPLFNENDKDRIRRRHNQYQANRTDLEGADAFALDARYEAEVEKFLQSRGLHKRFNADAFSQNLDAILESTLLSNSEIQEILDHEDTYTNEIVETDNRAKRGLLLEAHEAYIQTFLKRDPLNENIDRIQVSKSLLYGVPCHTCREVMERLQEGKQASTLEALTDFTLVRNLVLWDGRGLAYQDHDVKRNVVSEQDIATRGLSLSDRRPTGSGNLLVVHDDAGKRGVDYVWHVIQGDPALQNRVDVLSMNTSEFDTIQQDFRKRNPDLPKAIERRIYVLPIRYLLTSSDEREIYGEQISQIRSKGKHIEPHTLDLISSFAVWTRLQKPDTDNYTREGVRSKKYHGINEADINRIEKSEDAINRFLKALSPDRKAQLFDGDASWLLPSERTEVCLETTVRILRQEIEDEGRYGLSPSRVRDTLLDLADGPQTSVGPYEAIEYWKHKCKDRNHRETYFDIPFDTNGDTYGNPRRLLHLLRDRILDVTRKEFEQTILGPMKSVEDRFSEYMEHVKAHNNNEKLSTSKWSARGQDPNTQFMAQIESLIGVGEEFRRGVVMQVAAWHIDHPGQPIDYSVVFETELNRMRKSVVKENIPDKLFYNLQHGFVLDDISGAAESLWTTQIAGTTQLSELYRPKAHNFSMRDKSYRQASEIVQEMVGTHGYSAGYAIRILSEHLKHLKLDAL